MVLARIRKVGRSLVVKLDIREGTRLMVEAEDGRVVFRKVSSIFDLAGKSKMTRDEAFKLLDKMREEG